MRLSDDNSELIRVGSGLEGILNHAGLVCRPRQPVRNCSPSFQKSVADDQSCRMTFRRELCTCSPPLYSINPNRRNLFMKKLTRDRVAHHLGERLLVDLGDDELRFSLKKATNGTK